METIQRRLNDQIHAIMSRASSPGHAIDELTAFVAGFGVTEGGLRAAREALKKFVAERDHPVVQVAKPPQPNLTVPHVAVPTAVFTEKATVPTPTPEPAPPAEPELHATDKPSDDWWKRQ